MSQNSNSFFDENEKGEIPVVPKKWTRWKIFFSVSVIAVLTIFYVDNVVRVNNLLKEIQNLKKNYRLLHNNNELLKIKLNEIQSPERIIAIAEKELGMYRIDKAPEFLP